MGGWYSGALSHTGSGSWRVSLGYSKPLNSQGQFHSCEFKNLGQSSWSFLALRVSANACPDSVPIEFTKKVKKDQYVDVYEFRLLVAFKHKYDFIIYEYTF